MSCVCTFTEPPEYLGKTTGTLHTMLFMGEQSELLASVVRSLNDKLFLSD